MFKKKATEKRILLTKRTEKKVKTMSQRVSCVRGMKNEETQRTDGIFFFTLSAGCLVPEILIVPEVHPSSLFPFLLSR